MQRIRDELRRARQPALALLTALLLGSIIIVLTDVEHLRQVGTDPLAAIGGTLATGVKSMVVATGIPLAFLTVIVALAIMFVAAPELTRAIWGPRPPALGRPLRTRR